MVHADVEVTGFQKFQQAGAKNFKLFHALGETAFERTLLFFEPGNVRVAEESDAIRREFENLIDGVGKGFGGLKRKAVNEIDVDALKAEFARRA